MPMDCIPFRETNYFSSLICDYLDEKTELQSFYHRFPKLENFKAQIEEKKRSFSLDNRKVLVAALQQQYKGYEISGLTSDHIESLKNENTFTVVTGHQLNLFTGPLYFLYKIISTINLTTTLKEQYPDQQFVPVYWMATEDHDFDEINFFNLFGKKIQWNRDASGPVGVLDTEGLDEVFEVFAAELGIGKNAEYLKEVFKKAYLQHKTLAEATRYVANTLFGEYGLVIIDGDDTELKRLFVPFVEKELLEKTSHATVLSKGQALENLGYKVQVNPREINLFYMKPGLRERIVEVEGKFVVNETDISWDKEGILAELNAYPERFSPNVIMRPLYQEVILPNLCYIGGGGELAYWLELKAYFDTVNIPFPMLLLRNSVLVKTEKQAGKMNKLQITDQELFLKTHELINRRVRQISDIDINFDPQREHLKNQFAALYELAKQTDITFLNAVKAQEIKQIKGLDALEKRLLRAQRNKLSDHVKRMTVLQNELFPSQSLQERKTNFSELYLEYGTQLIPTLMKHLNPLKGEFSILTM